MPRFHRRHSDVNVSQFTAIERLADMRAEDGAEQNRVLNYRLFRLMTEFEAAHGRIMDTDVALESTRFARHNILVQASAAMTASKSANQCSPPANRTNI